MDELGVSERGRAVDRLRWIRVLSALIVVFVAQSCAAAPPEETRPATAAREFRGLTWNIWHGGREDGEALGPARVVDVLRTSQADVIALQETYGSGERIARELGFHFHPRGTNVSILSRFSVLEDISVHEPFQCVGALLDLGAGARVAWYSIWLPYSAEVWAPGTRKDGDAASLLAACDASARELRKLHAAIEQRLSDAQYSGVPIVIAGDFNAMSHLDYSEVALAQYGCVADFSTSRVLVDAGFRDAYRELNPRIDRSADRTWTPRFADQSQDRIDYVYYRGAGLRATRSAVLEHHAERFPSDHAAVSVDFRFDPAARAPSEVRLKLTSYNIRHGLGLDGKLDLARTASTLRALEADLIALQEVDVDTKRCGGVNQAEELGRALGMHASFGAFMDYDGGRYGMALLSRWPLRSARSVRLPDGNEPRVALAVALALENGETLHAVNVHFDWVESDAFRHAQAQRVAEYLRGLDAPYVLLGDFNDSASSRTLDLFRALAHEVDKPVGASLTFPADEPVKEIDFVFCAPRERWDVRSCAVVAERVASDHRPVRCELELRSTRVNALSKDYR